MCYEILIGCCIVALLICLLNLKAVGQTPHPILKISVSFVVSLTALRYMTLIIYGGAKDYQLLESLRYFYLMSSVGIVITTMSAIWYVVPCYKEKMAYPYFMLGCIPWVLFYLYIIIKQPTEVIRSSEFGYELILTGKFPVYLRMAQGSLAIVVMVLCGAGILKYKHLQIRTQLFLIILSQLLLMIDGLSIYTGSLRVVPPFTLTEAFMFFVTYYIFSEPIKQIHALKNQ